MKEAPVGFDTRKEYVLCIMLLDDRWATHISVRAGEAFWRAFIVENKETHEISANFRFRYKHGCSWFRIKPHKQGREETLGELTAKLEESILVALRCLLPSGTNLDGAVRCYFPPEPEDSRKSIDWLLARDLLQ